jgi:homoserine kinase
MARSVTVKVPATSANMGPGFDCLGIALDIWNTVRVETEATGFEIIGFGTNELPKGPDNLVARSLRLVYEEIGEQVPDLRITCTNEIPLGRGLGSSSAAAVAGIVVANELLGNPMVKDEMLALAARIEGHPDNSAAAIYGGCQIVVRDGERLVASSVSVPEELWAVLFVPDVPMPTMEARSVLPTSISVQDAVFNMGRVGLLVNALATGDFTHLAVATQDRLHQPPREKMFHPMKVILRAALDAGALGAFLSGAGSSILALTQGREMTVGYEMAEAASKSGVDGDVVVTRPTRMGARVV